MKTPTGRAEGTTSALINLYPLLGISAEIKCLIYPFSDKYDVLLGYETMKELKMNINCQNDKITINGKNYKLENEIHYIDDKKTIKEIIRTNHIDNDTTNKLVNLISKYGEILKTDKEQLRSTNLLKHKITTNNDNPCYTRNYRYPIQFKEQINNEVANLLKNNIIRKSNSPYNSAVWIVPKKMDASGIKKVRMVIDYRKLNEMTIKDKYPLPNIEDLLNKLQNAKIFSTIDLASGFHQIEMDPDSISKTAFSTEDGHYEYLRMPYGLCNAPPTFQRAMNSMIQNVPNAMVYIDDIIIYSNTINEHLNHLENVFKKLKDHALSIQLDKTEFFKNEIPFLGYIVTPEGLKTNPSKIEAITKLPYPNNEKTTRQFLGMTGYYRKFIKNYANITKPISKALQTKKYDTSEIKTACDTLKTLMTNSPVLAYPDWNQIFYLTTDASDKAIGAVLSQKDNSGTEHPVAYASRVLQPPELNYSTIEKELLAIVWSTHHFKPYLYGTKFQLQTDHKPLKWIFTMKNGNTRIMKWIWRLQEFEFEINHINGKTNKVADLLSRQNENLTVNHITELDDIDDLLDEPMDENNPEYTTLMNELNELDRMEVDDVLTCRATNHSQKSSNEQIWIADNNKNINIEKHQIIIKKGNKNMDFSKPFNKRRHIITLNNQKDLEELIEQLIRPKITYGIYCEANMPMLTEWYDNMFKQLSTLIMEFYPTVKMKRYKHFVEDILDKTDQLAIISDYHEGKTAHRGTIETFNKLRKLYYFPLMKETINDYINKCAICTKTKYDRKPIKAKFMITPTPEKPFEALMIDTLHINKQYVATIVDTFSKRLFTKIINAVNGLNICETIKTYLSLYPTPNSIKMDNGPEYKNNLVQNFLHVNDIEPLYATAGNSNSLGLLNRTHSTLIEILRTLDNEKLTNKSLHNRLLLATIAYNNTLNSTLKMTPDEITFGLTKPNNSIQTEIKEHYVQKYHDEKEILQSIIRNKITKEKTKRTETLNQNREETPKIDDDTVYIKSTLKRKDKNPFRPVIQYKSGKYTIDDIHVNRIKRPKKQILKQTITVSDHEDNSDHNDPMDIELQYNSD